MYLHSRTESGSEGGTEEREYLDPERNDVLSGKGSTQTASATHRALVGSFKGKRSTFRTRVFCPSVGPR